MLTRRKIIAFSAETTKGTAVSPTTLIEAYEPKAKQTDSMNERKPSGQHGGHTAKSRRDGTNTAEITFKTPLRGDGAGGWDTAILLLFTACGLKDSTGTLTPVTAIADQICLTMATYEDGRWKRISGAMGNFKLAPDGNDIMVEFTFSGVWNSVADVALPSTSYSTVTPIAWGNASNALSLNSVTSYPSTFGFETGNQISPDVNCGLTRFMKITDRSPKFETDPAAVLVATNDLYGKRDSEALIAASLSLTNGTDTFALTSSTYQILDIEDEDRDGTLADKPSGTFIAGSGDDEYSIAM